MLRKITSVIKSLSYRVIELRKKTIALCLVSAILLILSFPPFNIWLFAWLGFVPVFFALKNKTLKQSFFIFFISGTIFWSGIIYWLTHVTLIGTIILIVYLALYFACFGLIIRPATKNSTVYSLIFIPSVWVILEYIRGHLFTGFPWALLGYSQFLNLPVIQIADIFGVWGVSFLLMLSNVAIVEIIWSIKNKFWKRLKITIILLISLLCLSLIYGYAKLSKSQPPTPNSELKLSVIQGNIPQEFKWDREYSSVILDKYSALSMLANYEHPDLIIWPEAAIPGILGEDDWVYQRVFSLAKETKTPILTGAVVNDEGNYFGSALLIDSSGEIIKRYDKIHLVPFGEYIPLKKILPFLQTIVPIGDIKKGKDYTIFQLQAKSSGNKVKFAVLDCFEDVFPELAREFSKKGAEFLINITNDAWYKQTSAPYQHLQASVFRAIENRLPLARSANTGVSGFIAPTGEIISLIQDKTGNNIFVSGYLTKDINTNKAALTFYAKYGDILIIACLIFIFYAIIRPRFR